MTMSYVFKYRRRFFWKKIKAVGHYYEADMDKMTVYLEKGGLISIPRWKEYYVSLGDDFTLYTKKQMETQSGQKVDLKRDIK